MTAEQFAYWMQGFAELSGDAPPSGEQWKSIREHLATVFTKVTPPVGIPPLDLSKLGPSVPHRDPWDAGWIARQAQRLRSECAVEIPTAFARFEPLADGAETV